MVFLRNAWYVIGWGDEAPAGTLLARKVLGEPIVIFRDSKGVAHALADRCPHRFVPLHLGSICGDAIQCGYHGLQFDSQGRCVHNPHGNGHRPAAAKVRSYPLVERHNFLWIWMGDPDQCAEDDIPDFSFCNPEHWAVGKGYLLARVNYMLEIDNILDLSHVEFLHTSTLGASGISAVAAQVTREDGAIWSRRLIKDHILSDFLYEATRLPKGKPVDRWIDVRWTSPSNLALWVGSTPAGQPREAGQPSVQAHMFTPETESTTHYWFGVSFSRSMGPDVEQLAAERINGIRHPFETEDLPMLEAQQESMGDADFWALKPVLLSSDSAGVQVRRALGAMISEEQATLVPA